MVTLDMGSGELQGEHRTSFAGRELAFMRVSMGNPHAIIFDAGFDEAQMDVLGPQVSSALTGGSNVETVMQRSERAFDVIVWERGVGRTLACGTGAAAVGVALAVSNRAPFGEALEIRLPGGPLEIVVDRESSGFRCAVRARLVFRGQVLV